MWGIAFQLGLLLIALAYKFNMTICMKLVSVGRGLLSLFVSYPHADLLHLQVHCHLLSSSFIGRAPSLGGRAGEGKEYEGDNIECVKEG